MGNKKMQKMTPQQQQYQQLEQKHELKRPVLKNCIKAFLSAALFVQLAKQLLIFIFTFSILQNKRQEIQLLLH